MFHPGFRSAHWKYQHLVRISSCLHYGKLKPETSHGDDWTNVGTKSWSLKFKELLSGSNCHFVVMQITKEMGRETNFLTYSSVNIYQNVLLLQSMLYFDWGTEHNWEKFSTLLLTGLSYCCKIRLFKNRLNIKIVVYLQTYMALWLYTNQM